MTPDLSWAMLPGVLEAHLDGADVVLSVATEAHALQVLPVLVGYTLKGCRVVDGVRVTQSGSCRDIQPMKMVELRLEARGRCHTCNPHPLQLQAHEAIDLGDYERARALIRQLEELGEEEAVVHLETFLAFVKGEKSPAVRATSDALAPSLPRAP